LLTLAAEQQVNNLLTSLDVLNRVLLDPKSVGFGSGNY